MKKIYLSEEANPHFVEYLVRLGYQCDTVHCSPNLARGIASHPDLFMCKLGCSPDSPIFYGNPSAPRAPYPLDIPYNAVCTGKYFIHSLGFTDSSLMALAQKMEMILIDVPQGYTKCNVVVVDENSLITADKGIYKACSVHPEIDCLLVNSGHVKLPGFSTGFLGGASGRVAENVLFHGSLQNHPDFTLIKSFIESKGLETIWFEEFPLTDIGSVIESNGLKECGI